jgi:hypothetical protein
LYIDKLLVKLLIHCRDPRRVPQLRDLTIRFALSLGFILLSAVAAQATTFACSPSVKPPPPVVDAAGKPVPPVVDAAGRPVPPVVDAAGKPVPPVVDASGKPLPPPADASGKPVENSKVLIEPDPKAKWQPRGGTTRFTIKGNGVALDSVKVVVCFGWSTDNLEYAADVSIAKFETTNSATYSVVIPPNLKAAPEGTSRTALGLVPLAVMRIVASGNPAVPPVVRDASIGITRPAVALTSAVLTVLIAFGVFYLLGKNRGVPGRGILLWMISTRYGVASLSQAQIVLWTFLIAASAVYVMVLSGVLIEISEGTLILLGISGVALVGAKLQQNKDNSQADSRLAVPGAVIGVQQVGDPTDNEIRLAWTRPTTGGPVAHYLVQYRVTPAAGAETPWSTVAGTITRPHHTVLGLAPDTSYNFQVLAANAGGPSSSVAYEPPIKTLRQEVTPNAPGPVSGLYVDGAPTLDAVKLAWSAPAGGQMTYVVEMRRNDTTEAWTEVPVADRSQPACLVGKLRSGVAYDFRVVAVDAAGVRGPWSAVVTECTLDEPEWSDLIVSGDGRGEIDVTRAQMLLFTLVAALFVGMNVMNNFTIPDIPTGILLLMGISNGVYLTAKYIPE